MADTQTQKKPKIGPAKALKTFLESDGGRKVLVPELMELTIDERRELGALAAAELGCELT